MLTRLGDARPFINLLPLVVWPLYTVSIIYFWSLLSLRNPALDWAIEAFLPYRQLSFTLFLYAHDLALNLVLVLPVALILRVYAGAPSMLSVVVASTLVFVWQYWNVISSFSDMFAFFRHGSAIAGALVQIGIFPFAYWLAIKLTKSGPT